MENAFGADLSAVKLYESKAVADAGAKAISQGSRIAFAPGMLDFTSFGGQSLLGHEISHVVSQARGEVTGGGFLNDHALEARADREGAMAARGEQVAMPTAALSPVTAEAAAGPMQAKDKDKQQAQAAQQTQQTPPAQQQTTPPVQQQQGGGDDESDPIGTILEKTVSGAESFNGKYEELEKVRKAHKKDPVKNPQSSTALGDAMDKMGINRDSQETIGDVSDFYSGTAGSVQNMMELGSKYEEYEEAKKKGSKAGMVNAEFDMGKSGTGTLSSLSSVGKSSAAKFSTDAAKKAGKAFGGMGTAFDIGGAAIGTGKAVYNEVEATKRKQNLMAAIPKLQEMISQLPKEEQEAELKRALKIFTQGLGKAEVDQIKAAFDIVAQSLGLTGGILKATGVGAAASAATTGAKVAVQAVGKAVTDYHTDKFQDKTVDEEFGEETQATLDEIANDPRYAAVAGLYKDKGDIQEGVLRGHGYMSGTNAEAFQGLSKDRAHEIADDAKNGSGVRQQIAQLYTGAVGVDHTAEEAEEGVLDTLGGDKKQKFHDKNAMRYNAFEEGEKAKAEADQRTNWEGVKYYAGKGWDATSGAFKKAGKNLASFGKAVGRGTVKGLTAVGHGLKKGYDAVTDPENYKKIWGGIKTGAGKAATAVGKAATSAGKGIVKAGKAVGNGVANAGKAAWNGIQTVGKTIGNGVANAGKAAWGGLKSFGSGVKDFFTSADKRKEVWENVKSGAGKAVSTVGNGIKSAAASVKDFATNADTRKQVWENVKSGAGKAATAVGGAFKSAGTGIANAGKAAWGGLQKAGQATMSGLQKAGKATWSGLQTAGKATMSGLQKAGKATVNGLKTAGTYVGNVASHTYNKAKKGIVDWYQEGVDQMTFNKEHYDKMGFFSKLGWSLKNLPARLSYDSAKNQQDVAARYTHILEREKLLKDINERKRQAAGTPSTP
ncbi:MAG: DUF4157 domain-containing protein, partial [Clostridium lundense]|nr:DUF4157 domain-containing protein [Clostridium lundense]